MTGLFAEKTTTRVKLCVCVYVCISATSMLRSDGGVARVVAHINGDRFDYTDWK